MSMPFSLPPIIALVILLTSLLKQLFPLQTYVGGLLCNKCADGAFDNAVEHVDGCLQCVCMGITSNCGSSTWRYGTTAVPITSADGAANVQVHTETETVLIDVNMTRVNGFTAAQILLGEKSNNYWYHSDSFSGNLLGIYEGSVGFSVKYTTTDPGAQPSNAKLLILGRDNTNFFFNVGQIQPDVVTDVVIEISMENMLMAETGVNTTRADLLLGLTDVEMILLPATFYPRTHKS